MFYDAFDKPKKLKRLNAAIAFAMNECGLTDREGYIAFEFLDDEDMNGCYGFAHGDSLDNEYVIELNADKPSKDIISAIFHEMVHVMQIAEGRLIQGIGRKKSRWHGKVWEGNSYMEYPWEIEAYEQEKAMTEKWNMKLCVLS